MKKVIVFAGTNEGRRICEFLAENKISVTACVATEYGAFVIPNSEYIKVLEGRLSKAEIEELLKAFDLVIDATHPYANLVSENIKLAIEKMKKEYIRIIRPQVKYENVIKVADIIEACEYLNKIKGNVLVTTGSKELVPYKSVDGYQERLFFRFLPTIEALNECKRLEIKPSNIICMQGPFSENINKAMLEQIDAKYLVTKETGQAGGFVEKLEAAKQLGVKVILIGRPLKEEGLDIDNACKKLKKMLMEYSFPEKKEITIIGAGPGKIDELTQSALSYLKNCKEVYSFERIASLNHTLRDDIVVCTYSEIFDRVKESKAESIAILVSGDIGFFSVAKTLIAKLNSYCSIQTICGISSMQYFCSKLGISYENINVVSLHGRNKSILGNVAYNRYVFVLTDGVNTADKICKDLCYNMLSDVKVYVGEYLSMDNERIVEGTAYEISQLNFGDLAVLLIENQCFTDKNVPLFDEDFIRHEAPMTKEEIRWSSVNKLKLNGEDIVFDIGAGTGSVAIEMARKAYEGIVYAIEKNKNTFELLKENIIKLKAFNVMPILGEASEEIKKLPIPDKVFIGGSGGNLEEIIKYLYSINPNIRMVVNAITLETLAIAIEVFKEIGFKTKTVCINCAKNRPVGNYNMMIANNPVYIISGEKYEE